MARHNETGKKGEETAASYLLAQGYTILARNYRYRKAEIDLIARKDNLLVFVEVKTRSRQDYGYPEEAVSARKIQLFLRTAEEYIYRTRWSSDLRFDIIAIQTDGQHHEVYHIEDAFH
ncbi:MAG: YraN family protein [Adhaeribacter sp.]